MNLKSILILLAVILTIPACATKSPKTITPTGMIHEQGPIVIGPNDSAGPGYRALMIQNNP